MESKGLPILTHLPQYDFTSPWSSANGLQSTLRSSSNGVLNASPEATGDVFHDRLPWDHRCTFNLSDLFQDSEAGSAKVNTHPSSAATLSRNPLLLDERLDDLFSDLQQPGFLFSGNNFIGWDATGNKIPTFVNCDTHSPKTPTLMNNQQLLQQLQPRSLLLTDADEGGLQAAATSVGNPAADYSAIKQCVMLALQSLPGGGVSTNSSFDASCIGTLHKVSSHSRRDSIMSRASVVSAGQSTAAKSGDSSPKTLSQASYGDILSPSSLLFHNKACDRDQEIFMDWQQRAIAAVVEKRGSQSSSGSTKSIPPSLHARISKTKICIHNLSGNCIRGASCTFAHSIDELREPPNLLKTRFCNSYLATGTCSKGALCKFAHGEEELRWTPEFDKTSLCPHLRDPPSDGPTGRQSRCRVGDACRWAHSNYELRCKPASHTVCSPSAVLPRYSISGESDPSLRKVTRCVTLSDDLLASKTSAFNLPSNCTFVPHDYWASIIADQQHQDCGVQLLHQLEQGCSSHKNPYGEHKRCPPHCYPTATHTMATRKERKCSQAKPQDISTTRIKGKSKRAPPQNNMIPENLKASDLADCITLSHCIQKLVSGAKPNATGCFRQAADEKAYNSAISTAGKQHLLIIKNPQRQTIPEEQRDYNVRPGNDNCADPLFRPL